MDKHKSRLDVLAQDSLLLPADPGLFDRENKGNKSASTQGYQKGRTRAQSTGCHYFSDDPKQIHECASSLLSAKWRLPKLLIFLIKNLCNLSAYRCPMTVGEYVLYQSAFYKESAYYICPRCDVTLDREYQTFCDRCGQRLNWKHITKANLRCMH